MTDTEWTPERRKIREAERVAALATMRDWYNNSPGNVLDVTLCRRVDELYPPPPPEYTYGREIKECWTTGHALRRRSDGRWEFRSKLTSEWFKFMDGPEYDAHVRAKAAEVPLSDAECREIGSVCRAWHETSVAENKAIRAVVQRVLRGEVKGNG